MQRDLYKLHAEICKILAHPKRLRILEALGRRPYTVTELTRLLRVPMANISQHLAILRQNQIVTTTRSGQSIKYALVSPKVIRACRLMREVLLAQIRKSHKLLKGAGRL